MNKEGKTAKKAKIKIMKTPKECKIVQKSIDPYCKEVAYELSKIIFGVCPTVVKIAWKGFGAIIDGYNKMIYDRVLEFARSFEGESRAYEEFKKLSKKQKEESLEYVLSELQNEADKRQNRLLGYLYIAWLKGRISEEIFHAISFEIKNINPIALKKQYPILIDEADMSFKDGFYQLLSPKFISNTSYITNNISIGNNTVYATELCGIFLREGYYPYICKEEN